MFPRLDGMAPPTKSLARLVAADPPCTAPTTGAKNTPQFLRCKAAKMRTSMIGASPLLARRLLRWYEQNRRDLPWRPPKHGRSPTSVDPYHVLVSEAMLQQTQVATVIPYFKRFIQAFPSVRALAKADEQQVLRL